MPSNDIKPALRIALRLHEIGDATPYKLFFAGKGKSGGSFGFMQGDLAAHQKDVTKTFRQALTAAGIDEQTIDYYIGKLSVHRITNPLSPQETKQINDALSKSHALVDAMDEGILEGVYDALDVCIARAEAANRTLAPKAQIYIALWINMTGPPSKLLTWLDGGDPGLPKPVPKAPKRVDGPAMEKYLQATSYYSENPGNFPHMLQSAAAGAAGLPPDRDMTGLMAVAAPAGDGTAGDEPRGRMLIAAAAAFGTTRAAAQTGAEDAAGPTGDDSGEFASQEVEGVFTTNTAWLDAPLTPAFMDLYLGAAPLAGFDFEAFAQHIAELGLQHFDPIELLYLGASHSAGKCKGTNSLPPASLWKNIDRTARMLDRIRAVLGAPIRILSAYRAPAYNSCIGGETASKHMLFNAIDWTCDAGHVSDWHKVARQVRGENPDFTGGIGVYPAKNFIHIDTRGHVADWSGST